MYFYCIFDKLLDFMAMLLRFKHEKVEAYHQQIETNAAHYLIKTNANDKVAAGA